MSWILSKCVPLLSDICLVFFSSIAYRFFGSFYLAAQTALSTQFIAKIYSHSFGRLRQFAEEQMFEVL